MTAPIFKQAHDYAATLIGAAIGLTVARDPSALVSPAEAGEALLVAVLATGPAPAEIGYLLGSAKPYEFEQRGRLEILAGAGTEAARETALDIALGQAEAAIAADRTLGGLVDFASLETPELDVMSENESRGGRVWAADLVLTYSAPTALG